jgi:uncharacterized protein (TIGR04255 family)
MAIQYEHAPITEALIDIRVENPPSVTLAVLEGLHEQVADNYPKKQKRMVVVGEISAGDAVGASASQIQIGFAFSSSDSKQVFQARTDGFTFSRLRPYINWTQLRDEAENLWGIYRQSTEPIRVSRVAVRFINQIDIPAEQVDYKEYFRTTPEVSPELPQGISGFFMELHFPQPEFAGMLVLRQAAVTPLMPDTTSVILDLDVFKEISGIINDGEIWRLLEELRARKNQFFEGSLTEEAKKLFGERKEY